jgi:hypothetical protein
MGLATFWAFFRQTYLFSPCLHTSTYAQLMPRGWLGVPGARVLYLATQDPTQETEPAAPQHTQVNSWEPI